MNKLIKFGRMMFGTGILLLGILCIIYKDFILGRPPAWSGTFAVYPALAYVSAAAIIIASIAILFRKDAEFAALLIAVLIFLLSFLRHLPHFMNDWLNAYKSIALVGGALIVAASFFKKDSAARLNVSERKREILVLAGSLFIAVFFIACGYAHFKWAEGVQNLIPSYIPFRLFWVYFCGICLFAAAIGLLIPQLKRWASLLAAIMILGWFILFHIPRFAANPDDPSDRMGLCESFAFSGVLFILAGMYPVKEETDRTRISMMVMIDKNLEF
jgi:uncharacterized membrane protein